MLQRQQQLYAPGEVQRPVLVNKTPGCIMTAVAVGVIGITLFGCLMFSQANTFTGTGNGAFWFFLIIGMSIAAPIIVGIARMVAVSTKKSPEELLAESERIAYQEERSRYNTAVRAASAAPDSASSFAVLGAAWRGSLPWCSNEWLIMPRAELMRHGVVVGGSGSGKTVSLLRLAYVAATVYGMRVFYIDAKGDRSTAAQFVALMRQVGKDTRMYPRESMDGWRGDGNAVLNRLMAVESWSEAYYKAVAKRVLSLVCQGGAPANSRDFFNRMTAPALVARAGLPQKEMSGVELRYRSFFDVLAGKLDSGWSWEDADAGYILLDGLSLREEAASLGRFLIEDFAAYAVSRKRPGRDLLIIDEYSALATNGTEAANLVERLRSYDCAVVLSSQSYAGLGEQQDAERILDAANWLMVHQTAAPERLTRRAGSRRALNQTYHYGGKLEDDINDRIAAREEEAYEVHPDQARRLAQGDVLLIAHGRYLQARMASAPIVPAVELAQARAWIDQQVAALPPAVRVIAPAAFLPPIQPPQPPQLMP